MNRNLEIKYRKIPSLKFLYEISVDGRYLRNVKSKRYIKMFDEISLSGKRIGYVIIDRQKLYIDVLLNEIGNTANVFIVKYPLSYIVYSSFLDCCGDVSAITGLSMSTIKEYLKQKRKKIRELEIIYI